MWRTPEQETCPCDMSAHVDGCSSTLRGFASRLRAIPLPNVNASTACGAKLSKGKGERGFDTLPPVAELNPCAMPSLRAIESDYREAHHDHEPQMTRRNIRKLRATVVMATHGMETRTLLN